MDLPFVNVLCVQTSTQRTADPLTALHHGQQTAGPMFSLPFRAGFVWRIRCAITELNASALPTVGTVVFGTLVGTVGSTIGKRNMLEEKNSLQLQELKEYMNARRMPGETKKKLRRYLAQQPKPHFGDAAHQCFAAAQVHAEPVQAAGEF